MRPLDGRQRRLKPLRTPDCYHEFTRIVRVNYSVLDLSGHWAPRMRVFCASTGYQHTDPLALRGHASTI